MIVSNHESYLKKAKHLTTQAKSDELYFLHDEIGYNYRMTNLQAAMGLAQLEQIEHFIEIKTENYKKYKEGFKNIEGLELLDIRPDIRGNYWFYALICKNYKMNRDEMIRYLQENQVQTRPVWGLIHEQLPYRDHRPYEIEKARYYWEYIVNIPCSTNLTGEDVQKVIDLIAKPAV